MFNFIVGLIIGVLVTLIANWFRRERHEFIHSTCSRCGHDLEDWGPPGPPYATV